MILGPIRPSMTFRISMFEREFSTFQQTFVHERLAFTIRSLHICKSFVALY